MSFKFTDRVFAFVFGRKFVFTILAITFLVHIASMYNRYFYIDDCWHGERDKNSGEIRSNKKFPDMKELADYVHSLGLKIGLYTDCGPKTCAGFEGSEGNEQIDIDTYAR